jgi:uncharacterized membrane protein HdeD (DUF308 family)
MDGVLSAGFQNTGVTYTLIGLGWILAGVFYANIGYRLGRKHEAPNDGCLLQIGCQVAVLIGGAVFYFFAPFPWCILTSIVGAFFAPAALCLMFDRKMTELK